MWPIVSHYVGQARFAHSIPSFQGILPRLQLCGCKTIERDLVVRRGGSWAKEDTPGEHLSSDQNLGWLGYVGDYTTQLYRDGSLVLYDSPSFLLQGTLPWSVLGFGERWDQRHCLCPELIQGVPANIHAIYFNSKIC